MARRKQYTNGQRLATALRRLRPGRRSDRARTIGADLSGPVVRELCPSGHKVHDGVMPGRPTAAVELPRWGFDRACDRCGWQDTVDGPGLVAAYRLAKGGDRTVRLPLGRS